MPDAKTMWAFRKRLTKAGAIEALFTRFNRAVRGEQANATGLREPVHRCIPMSGQIVDASLVTAPKQRNTEREDLCIRTIGVVRAKAKIGLANLTYNIRRLVFHQRTAPAE